MDKMPSSEAKRDWRDGDSLIGMQQVGEKQRKIEKLKIIQFSMGTNRGYFGTT